MLFLLFTEFVLSQQRNQTTWPYNGVPDSSNYRSQWMNKIPLIFIKANFKSANFDSIADFIGANFKSPTGFWNVQFHNLAFFKMASFNDWVNFVKVRFDSLSDFSLVRFNNHSNFHTSIFNSDANFNGASFASTVDFRITHFQGKANFKNAQFNNKADFGKAYFASEVIFEGAQFKGKVIFNSAKINSKLDFRKACFSRLAEIDLSLAEIRDSVFVGIPDSDSLQKYDFLRAKLMETNEDFIIINKKWYFNCYGCGRKKVNFPGAKIVLYGPVNLKIQLEKFRFIKLYNKLNYFAKKDIISMLKDYSFNGNKYSRERFELDYLFAKSTMYQKESTKYEIFSIFHPISWLRFIYYATLGLGYRPFRLTLWILIIIIFFAFIYYFWIPRQINLYILKKYDLKKSSSYKKRRYKKHSLSHFTDTIINCLFFSSMLFFTFRLKGELITFFNTKQKRVIVLEYLIGLLIYIAFLTLTKEGSILHTIKSLFVG